jgi:hypothetical protein
MVAIANSYFEGLEKATGKLTPFYPDCSRVENGNLTANNPKANNPMSKLSCGAQFDTGFSKIITEVRERRYPLVDEERGLVYAGVVFDHVGGSSVKMADGSILEVKAPGNAPHSVLIAELFKIKNGKIQQIEAVVLDSPYKMPSGWGAGPCGRECLNAMVDRYLDAVVAHDAARLPLAPGVRFTENGQHLELNDGLWNTASERGGYKLYIPDAQAGQVGFFGTIRERGVPAILAVRLKVESGKISEIETLVARSESGAKLLEKLGQPHPSFLETIPPAERASREEVIRVSNMYFSGLERNDGKGEYPFTDDCNRLEDGKQTTNNPDAGWVYDGVNFGALGCKAQFETGFFHFVTRIRDRRFVVVDEERGLGLAFAFFDHAGNLAKGPTKPQTWELAELFKIVKGKIRQIEAVVEACPYGMLSGWSSREDGLSSRARW